MTPDNLKAACERAADKIQRYFGWNLDFKQLLSEKILSEIQPVLDAWQAHEDKGSMELTEANIALKDENEKLKAVLATAVEWLEHANRCGVNVSEPLAEIRETLEKKDGNASAL